MYDAAHGVAPTHEIFHKPLKVDLQFEDYATPLDYYRYPRIKVPREPIKVWRVQNKKFPEIDPGLVSSRETFVNTQDAEIISGGINSKGPDSVAIGRHANFFLWGFSAQPSDMTPDGRKCFVNAVYYIQKFDGHKAQPAQYASGGRESMVRNAYYLRSVSDIYIQELVKEFNERKSEYPEEALKRVGDDPATYFRDLFMPSVESHLQLFPAKLREQFGLDSEKYIRYYEDNLEYLRLAKVGVGYIVDEDVKALGISNRRIELLDRAVEMLEDSARAAPARRILQHYTGEQFEQPAQWRQWLAQNRDRLVFDEERSRFGVKRNAASD